MTAPFDPSGASPADSGIFGLPRDLAHPRVVLIPVPWEATTSYGAGTANGPAAILAASRQVDLFDVETGNPWQAGITMLDASDEVAAWNREARGLSERVIAVGGRIDGDADLAASVSRVNALSAKLNKFVETETQQWLGKGRLVGLVGGDHSTSFGCIAAMAHAYPGLGVLQIDAHADLRVAFEGFEHSHASIMHNVLARVPGVSRLVQVGIRDLSEHEHEAIRKSAGRVVTFFDRDLAAHRFAGGNWATQCEQIVAALPANVHISFDIDGLDPAHCPSTGTPVPGGLAFAEAVFLIAAVFKSGRRIVGFDLVEVAPSGGLDEWDANVGARLLYKLIGWMLRSNPG